MFQVTNEDSNFEGIKAVHNILDYTENKNCARWKEVSLPSLMTANVSSKYDDENVVYYLT